MPTADTFAEDRRAGLGGSDFPKLMIPNYKFGGPYDVYLEKTEGSNFTGNAATRRGHYLEPAVAQWYSDTTGRRLHKVTPETDPALRLAPVGKEWTVLHPQFDFLRGTPDFLTDDPDLGYEGKTANERQLDMVDQFGDPLWGPPGSDIVPLAHMIQCQEYMGLTGRRRWDLGCFFVGNRDEFRLFHLRFDPDFFASLVETGVRFWQDYILTRTPPPVDLVPSDRVISTLLTKAMGGGAEVRATPRLEELAAKWADMVADRKNTEDDEAEIKAEFSKIMAQLGAAKIKGTTRAGKNWSVAAREGGSENKPNHKALSAIFQRMLIERGAAGEDEIETILAANTTTVTTSAFIQGYFNSINKDRKALRAARKGEERITA